MRALGFGACVSIDRRSGSGTCAEHSHRRRFQDRLLHMVRFPECHALTLFSAAVALANSPDSHIEATHPQYNFHSPTLLRRPHRHPRHASIADVSSVPLDSQLTHRRWEACQRPFQILRRTFIVPSHMQWRSSSSLPPLQWRLAVKSRLALQQKSQPSQSLSSSSR